MVELAKNYQGIEAFGQDLVAYHTGKQAESENLMGAAKNNLDSYHKNLVNSMVAEEQAEETFSTSQGLYEEATGLFKEAVAPLESEIRSIKNEIRSMQRTGAPSASIAEYKDQLAQLAGSYEEAKEQLAYLASDMRTAQQTYESTVIARQQAESALESARLSYSPSPAIEDLHKTSSDISGLLAPKENEPGLAKVLNFSN